MEEELKKDHSDMQAVVDSKQKIIDAQVSLLFNNSLTILHGSRMVLSILSVFVFEISVCCRLCLLLEETKGH